MITGLGALSPLGLDLESFWNAILDEKDCIKDGIGALSPEQWKYIENKYPQNKCAGKIAQLSYFVAQEAMQRAGWTELNSEDGIILGTTTGQITHWENSLISAFKSNDYTEFLSQGGVHTPGESLNEFSKLINFNGKSMMIVSACSASTQALGLAAEWVKSGRVKRCLVGGAEVLTTLSVEGFRCLGLLSQERARPFDQNRNGINLSEAAAFYCVENLDATHPRAVACIESFATNSDAYHLTSPHPEGAGSAGYFEDLLQKAQLKAEDIDWVHAHGTASSSNDSAEATAIEKVFGQTPVTSTKAYHGHSLGAAGALETAICVQALRQQLRIKNLGLNELDSKLNINVQKTHEKASLKRIVKSSLGFGGVNAALLISHPSVLRQAP
ncbi:MAG: beta-ketoacyl-[acyl-carrier-protein] synthase family protein [Bdellovibrionota bacterium]